MKSLLYLLLIYHFLYKLIWNPSFWQDKSETRTMKHKIVLVKLLVRTGELALRVYHLNFLAYQ